MQVIPAILEKEYQKAQEKIEKVKNNTNWIQIDVTDGFFCPGKTFELELLAKLELDTTILWDVHLMVKNPVNWIKKCIFMGASRVTAQVEMMKDREDFVKRVKDGGMDAGLAFDIDTPVKNIPEETDLVLLLGRKAGFQKQDFDYKVFEKIPKDVDWAIDGGIDWEALKSIKEKKAQIAYCGGLIFNGNVSVNFEKIKEILKDEN
jgi:ribulose-phosphate 3-epimerase